MLTLTDLLKDSHDVDSDHAYLTNKNASLIIKNLKAVGQDVTDKIYIDDFSAQLPSVLTITLPSKAPSKPLHLGSIVLESMLNQIDLNGTKNWNTERLHLNNSQLFGCSTKGKNLMLEFHNSTVQASTFQHDWFVSDVHLEKCRVLGSSSVKSRFTSSIIAAHDVTLTIASDISHMYCVAHDMNLSAKNLKLVLNSSSMTAQVPGQHSTTHATLLFDEVTGEKWVAHDQTLRPLTDLVTEPTSPLSAIILAMSFIESPSDTHSW